MQTGSPERKEKKGCVWKALAPLGYFPVTGVRPVCALHTLGEAWAQLPGSQLPNNLPSNSELHVLPVEGSAGPRGPENPWSQGSWERPPQPGPLQHRRVLGPPL